MLYLPKVDPQESPEPITLLLPWYLDEVFIHFFNSMGFSVIHSYIPEVLKRERQEKGSNHRTLQRSIEKVVEHENYEWQTLRIQEDGKIKVE